MEKSNSMKAALLDFDEMEIWNCSSDGSFYCKSTDKFTVKPDTEPVKSSKSIERCTDEVEVMHFRSLHALSHNLRFVTEFPELCDVKFLIGEDEVPVYGVKAVIGTRSRSFYKLILKHLKKPGVNRTPKRSTPRKNKKCSRKSQHLEVPVRTYDTDVFRRLIQFVHSGSVSITMETVVGILCGAVQFGFKDLEKACLEMIQRGISKGSIENLIIKAREYNQHKSAAELLSKLCSKDK
ncbi:hypothetical protein ACJMK2_023330 [Sinanodonta woodiana]|uniref:BTB domain-containing protein n=1 Tax=Sinanodonta woodiana TaxID=1069815 RepID=A0ABD3T4L0_SINWO